MTTGTRAVSKDHDQLGYFGSYRRARAFLASVGFFITFAVVRAITHAIKNQIGPFHDIDVGGSSGGLHIHHLVWGILLLLIIGYLWLFQVGTGLGESSALASCITSVLYGVGAALTLDEFAIWLNVRDVYWAKEGRESIDAVILFGALLWMGFFGGSLWRRIFNRGSKS